METIQTEPPKDTAKLKFNRVVKGLLAFDFVIWGGWGLLTPIFAIFMTDNIPGGTLQTIGIASTLYWIPKSLIQLPVGFYLDKHKGERDDFFFLIFGPLILAAGFLGFIWAREVWHIYLLQVVLAAGGAFIIPSWGAIFTRHIDKGHEALTWGVDSLAWSLSTGISGALGAYIATAFGFEVIFIAMGVCSIISGIIPFIFFHQIFPRKNHALSLVNIKRF